MTKIEIEDSKEDSKAPDADTGLGLGVTKTEESDHSPDAKEEEEILEMKRVSGLRFSNIASVDSDNEEYESDDDESSISQSIIATSQIAASKIQSVVQKGLKYYWPFYDFSKTAIWVFSTTFVFFLLPSEILFTQHAFTEQQRLQQGVNTGVTDQSSTPLDYSRDSGIPEQ